MKSTALITCLLLLCSCTPEIWEDRSGCPSWFSLDFSKVDPNIKQLHIWFTDSDSGEMLLVDTVYSSQYDNYYEVELPRMDNLKCFVWGNINSNTILTEENSLNTSLRKKDGMSSDSLYYYGSKHINTRKEFVFDTVRFNKEFATVDFIMKGRPQKGDDIHIEVESTTPGQYIDRRFLQGPAYIAVDDKVNLEGNSLFRFRLNRQERLEDMVVKILGTVEGIPVEIDRFPLGEFLKKSNYTMTTIDLKDVTVTLDLSFNFITIKIEDWSTTYPVDIEI